MIQKLTEIGVNDFLIYKADLIDQSIAKKDLEKITAKADEIAINVCKQCGNNYLPSFAYFSSLINAMRILKITMRSIVLTHKQIFILIKRK